MTLNLRKLWSQVHWFLGITAGIVLAVVGVSGATLSFEDELLRWMNPGVQTVAPQPGGALAPSELLARVQAAQPDKRIASLELYADPGFAARVGFVAEREAARAPQSESGAPPRDTGTERPASAAGAREARGNRERAGAGERSSSVDRAVRAGREAGRSGDERRSGEGMRRSENASAPIAAAPAAPTETARPAGAAPRARIEWRYVDPYTAELLGQPRGQEFFRFMTQLHRRLVAEEPGKQVVGASTVALIILCLSGLYLRWPRRLLDWRAWFKLDPALKGRSFLWHLHAVSGTWALLLYLLAGLTGLYWSYDWYRNGLHAMAGVPRQAREAIALDAPARGAPDVGTLWSAFLRESGGFERATLTFPQQPSQAFEIRYLGLHPEHERASNRLVFDPRDAAVLRHERYADKSLAAKLVGSIFMVHSGGFFGVVGTILMMLASLMMPLFTVTGWQMYLDRRAKKRASRVAASAAAVQAGGIRAGEVLVTFASQSGTAERIAWQTAGGLQAAGVPVTVEPLARLDEKRLRDFHRALFIVSTFGDGEAPDGTRAFARRLAKMKPSLDGLSYGLLALGDRHYPTFCEFGRTFDAWLRRQGAQPLFAPVEMDNGNPHALQVWQTQLRTLGAHDVSAWNGDSYGRWRLAARRLLNPGSHGAPTYHIELEPLEHMSWQAGDVVELRARHTPARVSQVLDALKLDGGTLVRVNGHAQPLADVLARSVLPQKIGDLSAQNLMTDLTPLPPREFSIASVAQDGAVHLLVRQTTRADGTLGLASGWLTEHTALGGEVEARVRANPNFHAPSNDRPLILIGNGTGLAGLRAHLKARALANRRRNWLIFGERSVARDFYYRDEIEGWREQGFLERVDLAFSRDQAERVYVQHRLRDAADNLRAWLADGAAIYVCGSIEGMAPGVEAVLVDVLGPEGLEQLIAEDRYRRDVY